MLLADQIIPFLSSDDRLVRDQATRYFSEGAHSPPALAAEQCWNAINHIGFCHDAIGLIHLLPLASQTDASTRRLLAALDAQRDEGIRKDLLDVLKKIDFEQLSRHCEAIFARSDLGDDARDHLQKRQEFADLTIDALWQQLEQHALASRERYWNEIDHSVETRLIEALVRYGQPAIDRALAIINKPVLNDDILEIFAIEILGRLRYRPAMDRLLQMFTKAQEDDDVLREALQRNLPMIGGLELITPVEAFFFEQARPFQIYAAEAIARLRQPEAEAALIRLFDDPKNEWFHAELSLALLSLCTTDGLPPLVDLARGGFPEPTLKSDFEEGLVACSLMAEFDFAELPLLREVIVTGANLRRARRELAELKGISLDQLDDDLYEEDFKDGYEDDTFDDLLPPPTRTIRNEHPKIGRNDPCPCGSGKKYKKCCLNKG